MPLGEALLVQQPQPQPEPVRQPRRAAADDHRGQVDPALVDQAGPQRVGGERGPADAQVGVRASFSARTAAGSNERSSRVRGVDTASRVAE